MDQRVWKVWQEGQKDPQYMKLYQKMFELERRFEETMLRLDDEARDAVMDYVMQMHGPYLYSDFFTAPLFVRRQIPASASSWPRNA